MRERTQDLIFVGDMVDLLRFDEFNFLHDFNTRIFGRIFLLYESNSTEGSLVMTMVPSPRIVMYSNSLILISR